MKTVVFQGIWICPFAGRAPGLRRGAVAVPFGLRAARWNVSRCRPGVTGRGGQHGSVVRRCGRGCFCLYVVSPCGHADAATAIDRSVAGDTSSVSLRFVGGCMMCIKQTRHRVLILPRDLGERNWLQVQGMTGNDASGFRLVLFAELHQSGSSFSNLSRRNSPSVFVLAKSSPSALHQRGDAGYSRADLRFTSRSCLDTPRRGTSMLAVQLRCSVATIGMLPGTLHG